jgi:hypothetical protein
MGASYYYFCSIFKIFFMKETDEMKLIQLGISRATKTTIFRNNTGMGWIGKVKNAIGGGIFIKDPRPLHAGLCLGSSDLIGWTEKEITPDMVGKKIAIFTAVEVKKLKGSSTSSDQLNFLNRVRNSGGISGIAKTPEEAVNLINNFR